MTIKYLHIRQLNEDGGIDSHGGISVAYTCTLTDICLSTAFCCSSDLFNYDIARRITRGRLLSPKVETTIIPLTHPITQTIVDWVATQCYENPVRIFLDDKHRWVSTFEADDGVREGATPETNVSFEIDNDWLNQLNPDDVGHWENGGMRYDG